MHCKEWLAQALTTANLGYVDLNSQSGIAAKSNWPGWEHQLFKRKTRADSAGGKKGMGRGYAKSRTLCCYEAQSRPLTWQMEDGVGIKHRALCCPVRSNQLTPTAPSDISTV